MLAQGQVSLAFLRLINSFVTTTVSEKKKKKSQQQYKLNKVIDGRWRQKQHTLRPKSYVTYCNFMSAGEIRFF